MMPTPSISRDLRERIVAHYDSNAEATYVSTGELFGVGEATVNRFLRLKRETGDVAPIASSRTRKHKVDRLWLAAHVKAHPDARLKDRVSAYETERGVSVSVAGVWYALIALGYTHKKNGLRERARYRAGSQVA
jgi:transposase